MMNSSKQITVTEALERLKRGESLEGQMIDFKGEKIKALDAFKLGKAGFEVPDELIGYEDADIAYDPEFDEYEWERTEEDPIESLKEELLVKIELDKTVTAWIKKKDIKLSELLEKLIQDFYSANQMIQGGK
jgi:hypothetical protein